MIDFGPAPQVREICEMAFSVCGVKYFNCPSLVTEIPKKCFHDCVTYKSHLLEYVRLNTMVCVGFGGLVVSL